MKNDRITTLRLTAHIILTGAILGLMLLCISNIGASAAISEDNTVLYNQGTYVTPFHSSHLENSKMHYLYNILATDDDGNRYLITLKEDDWEAYECLKNTDKLDVQKEQQGKGWGYLINNYPIGSIRKISEGRYEKYLQNI